MIPVGTGTAGDLVTGPGLVQYGPAILPGWADLIGWRSTPDAVLTDVDRPQGPGSYAGDVTANAKVVTYLMRLDLDAYGQDPAARLADLRTVEVYTPMDGIDRPLVVDDGLGPLQASGRVISRVVPQGWEFMYQRVIEVTIQWRLADPKRYSLATRTAVVGLATSTGGLGYPLVYPLSYGTSVGGEQTVTNAGDTPSAPVVTLTGPLTAPIITSTAGWRLGFSRLTLVAGETLVVDVAKGTALLNGQAGADRMYTIDPNSSPVEACLIPKGTSTIGMTATQGTGTATVAFRDAYL